MTVPADLSNTNQNTLKELSFDLVESSDNGMWKYYLWKNPEMQFALTYDRGYYECEIVPHNEPINPMGLIRLLRFLKNDANFYKQELIDADLWYTLTVNDYVGLFHKNYNLISDFLKKYNQEQYDRYDKFEFSFEGI